MNPSVEPRVASRPIGRLADGRELVEYTLDAGGPVTLSALNLGGIVTSLRCPDREGRVDNVVLALASVDDHVTRNKNFGGLIGRYANRIDGGRFTLGGQPFEISREPGKLHSLHGGVDGFCSRLWRVTPLPALPDGSVAIELSLTSEHGDQGFPGRLVATVRYTLTPKGEWRIDYRATTDRPTVVNLTHHAYWNLAGQGSVLGHMLTLASSRYAAVDEGLMPLALDPVQDTPFDFRAGACIEDGIRTPHEQIRRGRGYDHHFEINREGSGLAFAARLEDPVSGRTMEIHTTEPGVQFYSGNFLDGSLEEASGRMLRQGDGLCLETQHAPDSPNRSDWPSTVLLPGQEYSSTTVHTFGCAAA
jgi:aldose 1-epimerase